jgi:hypothetical protein
MTPAQRLRQLANLLNASTPLGLLLARLAGTPTFRGPRGLIIATGYRLKLPVAGAFTVGNVIIYRAGAETALANPVLLGHEERHSTQYACCAGLPFLVLYFAAAGWSLLRHGDPASGNPFERHAGLEAGGYVRLPARDTAVSRPPFLLRRSRRGTAFDGGNRLRARRRRR